jgi:hypothetical protein
MLVLALEMVLVLSGAVNVLSSHTYTGGSGDGGVKCPCWLRCMQRPFYTLLVMAHLLLEVFVLFQCRRSLKQHKV